MKPRSSFVLDVRDLSRRPGMRRDVTRELPAPEHLGLEMIAVPPGSVLDVDVRLESVSEGILATGLVGATVRGQCGRCLEDFQQEFQVDFLELFAYPDSATQATTDPDEISRLIGEKLDLEPVLRDAVVLSLPLTPLCEVNCAGLCVDCGERLDDLPPGHSHEVLDGRWLALRDRWEEIEVTAPPPMPAQDLAPQP